MAALLFRLFFTSLVEFVEAFYRPDFATLKLIIWAALSFVMGFSAYRTLPRHIPQLAVHRDSKGTNEAIVAHARTDSTPLTNAVATPAAASVHGFKVGDNVQIAAVKPPIALRSAVITSIDETQVVVSAIGGPYTILWKDLTGIKPAPKTTR